MRSTERMRILAMLAAGLALAGTAAVLPAVSRSYAWSPSSSESLASRFAPPPGYRRVPVPNGSFAYWLRHLPVKPGNPPVRLYNGEKKANQDAHLAVIDIDVGDKNLQQCADAVMRLRAEYLYGAGQADKICFHFTSGDQACYSSWAAGDRPRIDGNRVTWVRSAARDTSYAGFRRYLDTLFTYAGTWSLRREMQRVAKPSDAKIGDVFVQGGFPGHAVLIVDMAAGERPGDKVFMLVQSFMPAQDIHLLRAPAGAGTGPWFKLDFGDKLRTPEWTFSRQDLRRFIEPS